MLKLDVQRYFPSIRHDCVMAQLRARIDDVRVFALFATIVDSYHSDSGTCRGLPIGNLNSQFLANLHLDDLDHYVSRSLGVPAYLRYVDDLFLPDDSKRRLWLVRDSISARLAEIGLSLKPGATRLQRASERVDVLGYGVAPRQRWLRNENGYRFRRRLRAMARRYAAGELTLPDAQARVQAWIGHARHGDTEGLRRTVLSGVRFTRSSA